jgi:hypothetical protein
LISDQFILMGWDKQVEPLEQVTNISWRWRYI